MFKRYWGLWSIFISCMIINLTLSVMTWEEVRSYAGWVKIIPQKTSFKLRHIVQFSPQSFILCFAIFKTFNFSIKKTVLYGVLIMTFTGVISESIQFFIPSRLATIQDVLWNFLASSIGGLFFFLYSYYRKNNDKEYCG